MISLQSKGLSRVFFNTTVQKHQFLGAQPSLHIHTWLLEKWTFVSKVMSLLFNTLPRFVIAFLSRSKYLSISWRQSPSTVILEPKKIKFVTVSIASPSIGHEVIGLDAIILFFWNDLQWLESVLWDSGKVMEVEVYSLQTRKGDR